MTEHERIASAVADMPSTQFDTLTERERECAIGIALGWTNGEIAHNMGISSKTIDTHRAKALRKLGVRNNVELCRLAISCGVVSVGSEAP